MYIHVHVGSDGFQASWRQEGVRLLTEEKPASHDGRVSIPVDTWVSSISMHPMMSVYINLILPYKTLHLCVITCFACVKMGGGELI